MHQSTLSMLLKLQAFCALTCLMTACAMNPGEGEIAQNNLHSEMSALDPVAEDVCALLKERHALAQEQLYLTSHSAVSKGDNQGLKDIEEALKGTAAASSHTFAGSDKPGREVKYYQSGKSAVADDLSAELKLSAAPGAEQGSDAQNQERPKTSSAQSSGVSALFASSAVFNLDDLLVYALKGKLSQGGAALCASSDLCSGQTLRIGAQDTGSSQILVSIDEGSSRIYRLYQKSGSYYAPASQFSIAAAEEG